MIQEVKLIVIKNYQEFTEEIEVEGIATIPTVVAKEVEAVIQTADDSVFSIGFSVMRDNTLFRFGNPRNMVKAFLTKNFGIGNFGESEE